MTISSDSVKNSFSTTGKGTSSELDITFPYFDNSELEVYLRTSAGVETKWALTTNYTISGGPGSSPKIILVTDPDNDGTIIVRRSTAFTQLTDYASGDAFPADTHETALDRVVALAQQLKETLGRSFTYPNTYENPGGRSIVVPEPENNAIIKWNTDATALVNDTDLATSTYKLKVTDNELTPNYLDNKLVGGTGLTKATTDNDEGEETITFNVDAAQTQIISVGALANGSIASGFGTISTTNGITTTGAVSAGTFAGAALDNTTTLGTATDKAATQNAVKTYVDNQVAAINDDATTSNKGVASFNSESFSVSSGHVSVKTSAILDAPVLKATDTTNAGKILFKEGTDNGTNSVTLAGPAATADVTVTLPATTDTLVGKATVDSLTNKTFDLGGTGNSLTGSLAEFNTALQSESFCSLTGSETLTNKVLTTPTIAGPTLSATSNSVGGKILFKEGTDNGTNSVTLQGPASTADVTVTLPNSADTLVGKATTDTLTNKTITAPIISAPVLSATSNSVGGKILFKEGTDNGTNSVTLQGPASTADVTVTLPASADTLVGKATTDTLTNKTLTTPTIAGPTLSATSTTVGGKILFKEGTDNGTNAVTLQGPASTADVTVTLPASADTLVGRDTIDTLTNKTLNSPKINEDVAVTATATEINLLDGVSGLAQADFTKLAAVDSTAAELNLLDGSAKSTASITIADTDAFIVIDGTTTKQIPASDISTYAGGSVAGTPAGVIVASGSTTVPTGYFYCDGSAVSRTTYDDLFTAIGENYGQGDNSSTYNLPDFRGYFLRGQDDGSSHDTDDTGRSELATGGNTGDNIGSFQDDGTAVNNLSTSSSVSDPGHAHNLHQLNIWAGSTQLAVASAMSTSTSAGTISATTGISVSTSLSSSDNETRPKNVYVRYYIKY